MVDTHPHDDLGADDDDGDDDDDDDDDDDNYAALPFSFVSARKTQRHVDRQPVHNVNTENLLDPTKSWKTRQENRHNNKLKSSSALIAMGYLHELFFIFFYFFVFYSNLQRTLFSGSQEKRAADSNKAFVRLPSPASLSSTVSPPSRR